MHSLGRRFTMNNVWISVNVEARVIVCYSLDGKSNGIKISEAVK